MGTTAFDSLWDAAAKQKPAAPPSATPAQPAPDKLDALWKEPGPIERGLDMAGSAIMHLPTTAKNIYEGTKQDLETAGGYLGQRAAELTLPPDVRAMAESDPTRISGRDAALAGAQLATMVALPTVAGAAESGLARLGVPKLAARIFAASATGAAAGTVFNPNDPKAGAVAGATLGAGGELAGAGVKSLAKGVGSSVLDARGRPMDTQTITVLGKPVGTIEGLRDKATRLNVQAMANQPTTDGLSPFSDKPVAPMDVLGTAGVRAVRGLKTANPVAESIARDALNVRANDAVNRVIQHGLETTGLASRENGVQVVQDMIDQRAQNGDANYQPVFAKYNQPIDDPRFAQVAVTPTGQQVLKRAGVLAADRGESIGAIAPFDPEALPPDKQALYQRLVAMNGEQTAADAMRSLGESTSSTPQVAPTLKQAHYVKLAFDDLLNGAPEPGSGGLGPNRAAAIKALRNKWVSAMDDAAPEYQSARQQYADESTLIRAAKMGQDLFKTDPAVAAQQFNALPTSAQDVFRRTGFDALASRVENGPADVERGVSKTRDQQRMALLFPDADSFDQFKQGLLEEGRLHANEQTVLGGSPTADKLSDLADMAGVTLPDVLQTAVTGRWHRLAGRAVGNLARKALGAGADNLTAERTRQLVAGTNGDVAARNDILARMGIISPQRPATTGAAWTPRTVYEPLDATFQLTDGGGFPRVGSGTPAPRLPSRTPEVGTVQQGPAMPIPQPAPMSRRLRGFVRATPIAGDAQHGAAMPVPQPLPLSRRLMSGGPVPTPTTGDQPVGPSIPMRGQSFEDAVQQALLRYYRANPEKAVSMTRDQQDQLAAALRRRLMGQ